MTERKSRFSPFLKQCFVTGAVCCNVVGHGCVIGFSGVLLPQLRDPGSPINLTEDMESWIASVSALSMVLGNVMTPPVMGRAGRKWAHYVVTLPVILGWLAVMLASNFQMLLIGRIFHGMSFGMFLPLRSVLVGEYTSPRHRGGFLTTIALAQTFGILFVHLIGSVTSFQITSLISMAFSIISLLMTFFSPESPSWLASQRKYDECRKVFIWLRGEEEMPELEKMIEASQVVEKQEVSKDWFRDAIKTTKKKEFYKPIALMLTINTMMQFAGGTLMAAYATIIIGLLMGPDVNTHVWMVALDFQRLIFNGIAVFVINKTKRRTMMFATGAVCAGSHLAMAGYVFANANGLLLFNSLWIPGILINVQFLSVAMGMVPLPSVIAGEVFPLQYRSLGGGISSITISATIFLVLKTFPGLISMMGLQGTYTLYSGILTACLVVTYYLLPETKGKTLQEIEEFFKGSIEESESDAKESEPLNDFEKKTPV